MDPHENNLFVSWGKTLLIGLVVGAVVGFCLSTWTVRNAVNRWDRDPRVYTGFMYRGARWVAYAPAEKLTAWYNGRAVEQRFRTCVRLFQEGKAPRCNGRAGCIDGYNKDGTIEMCQNNTPCFCMMSDPGPIGPPDPAVSPLIVIGYWSVLMGLLALLTHAFRLRRDQSILDQLWH